MTTFDDGAEQLLADVLAAFRTRLGDGIGTTGAVLHLRRQDAYVAVVAAPGAPPSPQSLEVSTRVWALADARRKPLFVDVGTGEAHVLGTAEIADLPGTMAFSRQTLRAFRERRATHIYALPIEDAGDLLALVTIDLARQDLTGCGVPPWDPTLGALVAARGAEILALPPRQPETSADDPVPHAGPRMQQVLSLLRGFAPSPHPILLQGQSGVGKTRLARWVHLVSGRPGRFVRVDASREVHFGAALSGWQRGAFTGAMSANPGLIREADGGTLFLDEIDKLDLDQQKALLQLLDHPESRQLAGDTRPVDVRVIAATNADLQARVERGAFLHDLAFRIDVLSVRIPPLAERPEEIGAWATHFLAEEAARDRRVREATLTDDALRTLQARSWTQGNLRALQAAVARAFWSRRAVPAHGRIALDPASFGARPPHEAPPTGLAAQLADLARRLVDADPGPLPIVNGKPLKWEQVFTAFLWTEAFAQLTADDALALLGASRMKRNNNHQKALASRAERRDAIEAWLEQVDRRAHDD